MGELGLSIQNGLIENTKDLHFLDLQIDFWILEGILVFIGSALLYDICF